MVVGIYDLVFALQMYGAAHQNERGVESVLVSAFGIINEELVTALDDAVLDTLFFALVVDAHVSKHT